MPSHAVGSVQVLNCARSHATTISTLRDFARKTANLICLIQEPWYDRHGNPPLLPNFNLFLPTPTKLRCTTYIRQLPGLSATTTFTAQDSFLGTTITLQQEQHTTSCTIFNLYSPGRPEPLAALLPLLNIPANCLIMGSLNAHHPWWQGPLLHTARTSPASHAIVHWLECNNFHLQNKPAIPTHHPRNGSNPSTIDLCLTHGDTTMSTLLLAIDDDITSDHSSLTLTLSLPYATPPPKPYRCWAKANWNSIGSYIQATRMDLSDFRGPEASLRVISNITLLIHQVTEATVPYKSQRKAEAPWWNHSLTLAKEATKRADRRARLTPTNTNRQDSQYKRCKWTTIVRNPKTTYHIH